MAHLRGTVDGARGNGASRLGTKESGLVVEAQSWEGKIVVHIWHDRSAEIDMCEVSFDKHYGKGSSFMLYHGPVGTFDPMGLGAFAVSEAGLSFAHRVNSSGAQSPNGR